MNKIIYDTKISSEWTVNAFSRINKKLDFSIESLKEVDAFLDEQTLNGQPKSDGLLADNYVEKLFRVACYVGDVLIKNIPGSKWIVDEDDSQSIMNISIKLKSGGLIWPMQRVMKRFKNGAEDNIYHYGAMIYQDEMNSENI